MALLGILLDFCQEYQAVCADKRQYEVYQGWGVLMSLPRRAVAMAVDEARSVDVMQPKSIDNYGHGIPRELEKAEVRNRNDRGFFIWWRNAKRLHLRADSARAIAKT